MVLTVTDAEVSPQVNEKLYTAPLKRTFGDSTRLIMRDPGKSTGTDRGVKAVEERSSEEALAELHEQSPAENICTCAERVNLVLASKECSDG